MPSSENDHRAADGEAVDAPLVRLDPLGRLGSLALRDVLADVPDAELALRVPDNLCC